MQSEIGKILGRINSILGIVMCLPIDCIFCIEETGIVRWQNILELYFATFIICYTDLKNKNESTSYLHYVGSEKMV